MDYIGLVSCHKCLIHKRRDFLNRCENFFSKVYFAKWKICCIVKRKVPILNQEGESGIWIMEVPFLVELRSRTKKGNAKNTVLVTFIHSDYSRIARDILIGPVVLQTRRCAREYSSHSRFLFLTRSAYQKKQLQCKGGCGNIYQNHINREKGTVRSCEEGEKEIPEIRSLTTSSSFSRCPRFAFTMKIWVIRRIFSQGRTQTIFRKKAIRNV